MDSAISSFRFGLPLALLVAHFIGDFVLQTDWMATRKSKDWSALCAHVAVYSVCFLPWGWLFAAITFASHLATDALTSRATSRLWFFAPRTHSHSDELLFAYVPNRRHWFFVVIGIDQLIHATTLALTFAWVSK